jgi:methionine aminopeptidase
MRPAGRVVATALQLMRKHAAVGVSLAELDQIARDVLAEHRATSPFLGYQPSFAHSPFPGVICASVNDIALHGIPARISWPMATCSVSTSGPRSTGGRATRRSHSPSARPAMPT